MANVRYVDRDGVHCCRTLRLPARACHQVSRDAGRIEIVTGAGDVILISRHLVGQGLYPSIDDDWWVCVRGSVVRCVFKPSTNG